MRACVVVSCVRACGVPVRCTCLAIPKFAARVERAVTTNRIRTAGLPIRKSACYCASFALCWERKAAALARGGSLGQMSPSAKQKFLLAHNIPPALEVPPDDTKRGISVHTDASRLRHLAFAVDQVPPRLRNGLHLEFGVRNALSINFLAAKTDAYGAVWDGFDSFVGLPSSGSGKSVGWGAGVFTRHGSLPTVRSNVRLHAGWFNETVPRLLDAKQASTHGVAFVHLDADLYESTAIVLDALGSRCAFRKGTVLSFDELFGTAAVLAHEYRALNEAAAKWQFKYEFISYALTRKSAYARAAVRITSRPQSAGGACELAAPVQPCRPRNVYIDAGVNWCVECRHPGNALLPP